MSALCKLTLSFLLCFSLIFDFKVVSEATIEYSKYSRWSGGAINYGHFVPSVIEFADGRRILLEVNSKYVTNESCIVQKQILDSVVDYVPITPQPVVKIFFKKKYFVKKDTFLASVFFATQRRRVILNFPPAGSVWHLPAGTSQLTSVLRQKGCDVVQRYGHIIGVEYLFNSLGDPEVYNALSVVRSNSATIQELYKSRLVLENASAKFRSDDKFSFERNNVYYHSRYQDGTVSGAIEGIKQRERHLFHAYFREIEIPIVSEFKPNLYGVSVGDERQLISGLILASMVKESSPDTTVVVGGNFFSRINNYKSFERNFLELLGYFDGIVYTEGFQPLVELASGNSFEDVSGLVWKNGDNLFVNPRTNNPTVFETLPPPDFSGGARQFAPEVIPTLYTQSHCPMACDFCDISAGSDTFGSGRIDNNQKIKPRTISPRQIALNMRDIGAHKFDITDEMFTVSSQIELGKQLKNIGYDAIWQCYMTINNQLLNPQVAIDLYNAGCRAVQFGLESMSKETLLRIHKQWNTPSNYDKILANFRNAGIQTHIFLIVGLPGEKLSESLKWVGFLHKYGRNILTIKSGRWRPAKNSPEVSLGKLNADIVLFDDEKPFNANRGFRYKFISNTKVDAVRDILEQACREHWAYEVTSTIPWWINRSRFGWDHIEEMSKRLPKGSSIKHLDDRLAQMRYLVKTELGTDVDFRTFEEFADFCTTLI